MDIKCLKCQQSFVSDDKADADGNAFCAACKEANKSIAQQVDEKIAARRSARGEKVVENQYESLLKKPKGSKTWFSPFGQRIN